MRCFGRPQTEVVTTKSGNCENMKLAVILVNYNGKKYNTACIESILANVGMEELKIVVVDLSLIHI